MTVVMAASVRSRQLSNRDFLKERPKQESHGRGKAFNA
jgi:hypothetical protein